MLAFTRLSRGWLAYELLADRAGCSPAGHSEGLAAERGQSLPIADPLDGLTPVIDLGEGLEMVIVFVGYT